MGIVTTRQPQQLRNTVRPQARTPCRVCLLRHKALLGAVGDNKGLLSQIEDKDRAVYYGVTTAWLTLFPPNPPCGQGKVMCFLFVFFFVLVSVPSLGSCTNGRNVDYDEMKTGDEPGFV
ncbi:predicted protein [Histoplasma capsulatum var. duboisii H88]|uniref:Predicted protein n=2 Tax=Ajellomyces capsulatus TaxID=5037 RepID=F0UN24_AJEC8|nr:predicted protein [Histoplasma capsulatum H143]EGC47491.1 predicted protein [Histoplasma capsulatum var. duboisii H88]